MKTATFPSVRVEPELREAAESVMQKGESLSAFVEQAIRENILRRQHHSEFVARGLASRDDAKRGGDYISADEMLSRLSKRLDAAKARSKTHR
ncbi:prevent-host-death protein [Caballeronia sp. SEWSISQ10-4 2]|uniref:YlcI/YnfO family protein n=1 Tax=Caballeronia sp. SEWSISQ10-4 2 TaxID=2937438 RepID=UPI00264D4819|nr:YlcI/YnfO family protein [Caballeronia sp. SEWSISQ10-4 2]MDN7183346.1 prevent-host-death protein [Caballeronia sp. SEWSISQ10-4 2]